VLTSIIIPTYNHAHVLRDAMNTALAQTADVEVIIIDDGSTDNAFEVVAALSDERVRFFSLTQHAGVCAARNVGIDEAQGEFVMFLDADDVIAPDKVARQLREFDDETGWILCDVNIIERGRLTTASMRYDYAAKAVGGWGWIQPLLLAGNFIPIMSPLVRRSVIGDIRFHDDLAPEDWHFWYSVAGAARCRYVPEVLATYRKQPNSRNTTTKPHPAKKPGVVEPLRLNLGCGTPNTRSWHPMPGLVNLDRSLGWKFEDGLGDFLDGSVAGITVSHALMYVAPADWSKVFAEFARVLQPGGVLRITEDDTSNPGSSRLGGWRGSEPAVALTDPATLRRHMVAAGFTVYDVPVNGTHYRDLSLCQAQHGEAPDVFFIEGIRECTLLLSPHSDDETLFAAFTVIRYRPHVVVCFGSAGDYGDTKVRTNETRQAVGLLGGHFADQWDGNDLEQRMTELDKVLRPGRVFAPSPRSSHREHREVADVATKVFGMRVTRFHTYDEGGKVRRGVPVAFEQEWVVRKRRAMDCYRTQLAHPRARKFFEDDLAEYQE
jgi:SAM-dependent methyltransferase